MLKVKNLEQQTELIKERQKTKRLSEMVEKLIGKLKGFYGKQWGNDGRGCGREQIERWKVMI